MKQFEAIIAAFNMAKDVMADKIITATRDQFVKNIDTASFDGKPWQTVKKDTAEGKSYKYYGKPPLQNTGQLKNAVYNSIVGRTWNNMKIVVDNPYAEYQNSGTETIPARPFVGESNELNSTIENILIRGIMDALG